MAADTRQSISFSKVIPKNTTVQFTERITGDATIERVFLRFYPGQQKSLHVDPHVVLKGTGSRVDLVKYNIDSEKFVSGDDDKRDFPVTVAVRVDDIIVIDATNTDLVNDYTLMCDIVVDYYGGTVTRAV